MEWPASFRLTRPDDHVVIEVTTSGIVAAAAPGGTRGFVLRPAGASGTITLRFPPQRLVEYASNAQGDRVDQDQPIFTDPSVLVLRLTSGDDPVPATVAGLLDAARRLPIVASDSHLDVHHLLGLQPPGGWSRLRHLAKATASDGRFELWSSALVERSDAVDGTGGLPVRLTPLVQDPDQPGPADDPWAAAVRDEAKLRNTLDRATANQAGLVTSDPTQPASLRSLRLSSLGGWLDLRGDWPDNNGLKTLTHVLSMGRDESQRRGTTGRLFPFGFRAVLTEETIRRLDGDFEPDERTAGLRTLATIRVTRPVVELPVAARALPFTRLELQAAGTPPGDAREPGNVGDWGLADQGLAILHVGDVPYRFAMEATDHAGGTFLLAMPLVFVPDGSGLDADGEPDGSTVTDEAVLPLWESLGLGFTDVPLGGQAAAVAPPPAPGGSARADGDGLPAPELTTMRLSRIRFGATSAVASQVDGAVDKVGLLAAAQLEGVLPTVDRFAPGAATAIATYADTYIDQAFAGANDAAGVFLSLAETKAVGVAGDVTGGLAQLGLPVTALSRERGAVVGAVENLLAGQPDLSFLADAPKLLGVIPLTELIPVGEGIVRDLEDAAKVTSEIADGVVTKRIRWSTDLFDPTGEHPTVDGPLFSLGPFRPTQADPEPSITIEQTITLDATGRQLDARSRCEIVGFELRMLAKVGGDPLVTVPFRSFSFSGAVGEKPDVSASLGRLRFGGFLSYLGRLVDLIDEAGFDDPPALAVSDTGVTSSFTFPIPSVAIGVFALQNISFGAELDIYFNGDAPTLAVRFSRASDRFRLTVAALAGGGYLEIELDTGGLKRITGALEFGAAAALDVLVATVSVEAMGGVVLSFDRDAGFRFTAYLRLRGHVDVASLISADISLTLTLDYEDATNSLIGTGELVLQLKVLFFSSSLRVPVERRFAGRNADPSFAELMAPPDVPGPRPWDTYCDAFMEDVA